MRANERFEPEQDPEVRRLMQQFYGGVPDDKILQGLRRRGYAQADAQRMLMEARKAFEAMPESAHRRNRARRGFRTMRTALVLILVSVVIEGLLVYVLHFQPDVLAIGIIAVSVVGLFFVGFVTWVRNRG
jgi:hypothetical protein